MEPFSFIPRWGVCLSTAQLHVNINSFLFTWTVKLLQKSGNEWSVKEKISMHMHTVNHIFCCCGNRADNRRKEEVISETASMKEWFYRWWPVICSPHFWNSVFIQSIYLFLTEVPGICSILELCLNGFPISVAHSHWTDPRPSIFFPLKEWMGANFPFKHPPLPTCCKDHLGSFHTGGNLWRFDS